MLVSTAPTRSRNCYRGNPHIDSATLFPSLCSHTALLTLRRSVTLQQPKPEGLVTRMRCQNRNNCQSRYHHPSLCQNHHLRSMNWAPSCAGHSQEHRERTDSALPSCTVPSRPCPPARACPPALPRSPVLRLNRRGTKGLETRRHMFQVEGSQPPYVFP